MSAVIREPRTPQGAVHESSSGIGTLTAIILAGGLGTRLRPVVEDRSKVVAEVRGRPFLSYVLSDLASAGIREAVLCTGHLADSVRDDVGEVSGELRIRYSHEDQPLDTAGAVRLALPLTGSDPLLVMNGDAYCDVDMGDLLAWHRDRAAACSIVLAEVADTRQYGRVETSKDGRVQGFYEKGADPGPGWVNAGAYLMSRAMLQSIPASRAVSLEREIFPKWVGRGLFGYRTKGRLIDIGTPESYRSADEFFASRPGGRSDR